MRKSVGSYSSSTPRHSSRCSRRPRTIKWTKRAGLVVTDNNQMKFARKCIAASLYPGILVHRAVGILRKQPPALRFIVDRAEFLEDPY